MAGRVALENGQLISPFLSYTQQEEQVIVTEGVEDSITAFFTQTFENSSSTSSNQEAHANQFHAWLEQIHL
jgi:hypothetical protein